MLCRLNVTGVISRLAVAVAAASACLLASPCAAEDCWQPRQDLVVESTADALLLAHEASQEGANVRALWLGQVNVEHPIKVTQWIQAKLSDFCRSRDLDKEFGVWLLLTHPRGYARAFLR